MRIPAADAQTLFDYRAGDQVGLLEYIADDYVRTGRWVEYRQVVLRNVATGEFWAFEYEDGLTENQAPTYPWEDVTEVELYRVSPREIVTVTYDRVKAAA